MQSLLKVKALIATLISLALLSGIGVSCSPAPVSERAKPSSAAPSEDLQDTYGVSVTSKSLCSDGKKTTLSLQIDLDLDFWQLGENDFSPLGKTYVDTKFLFFENNELYSTMALKERDEPVFDVSNHSLSTIQTFSFLQEMPFSFLQKTPLPDSEFLVRVWVFLNDLPIAYTPPAGVRFEDSGIVQVPREYDAVPILSECP